MEIGCGGSGDTPKRHNHGYQGAEHKENKQAVMGTPKWEVSGQLFGVAAVVSMCCLSGKQPEPVAEESD